MTPTHETGDFMYNGFWSANLSLDGLAALTGNGLLKLTSVNQQDKSHAFYPDPIMFKNSSDGAVHSFSTTFVFATIAEDPALAGPGFTFVIAPRREFPGDWPGYLFGLFNMTNYGNSSNHIFVVEFDTIQNIEVQDIDDNHLGIDVNGLVSLNSSPAGYTENNIPGFRNLSLISGKAMQVWVDYDGVQKQIRVTLAPVNVDKPNTPLLSLSFNLSPIFKETMYVGFSSSTGALSTSHYILGWSFQVNGQAHRLDLSQLPRLPHMKKKQKSVLLTTGLPFICLFFLSILVFAMAYAIRKRRKFAEVLEDWERDFSPHRFKYTDLYVATKGFRDQELLGAGGFGRVYRGVLPTSKIEIAVKRVSHESRQGMRQFIAEIVSIGRLRHRTHCDTSRILPSESQRSRVIKGVAYGLYYLLEGRDQVVIHRDIKASNILLDSELNGRLGDFGLAKLYDHGTDPQSTMWWELWVYSPENTRTARATTSTDVYAFGAFLLEVACGRRPIEVQEEDDVILVEWVFSCWDKGDILEARDPNLETDFVAKEVELVLQLGLLCSQSQPTARPCMRQVVQYLEGDLILEELSSLGISKSGLQFAYHESFIKSIMSDPSSSVKAFSQISSVPNSPLSGGR
ncbi:hypothetical protein EUGRSUZ_K03082 [Eucalyptus grandis]|uniref:Uncharacterized protein n=2 Tax=Eucalyptus grandis TaxID=71139 RepID=A0ACC3IYJ1_EUCGR|nr:hypothetical protein EUGRSUZ_K03082 [Eucalyptus grandis]